MKYYVVADVHGFFDELTVVLREAGFFEEKAERKLIICGDIFDRGDQPEEMQNFIVDLIEKGEVILIRGNHEDLMVELVDNIDYWMKNTVLFTHHYSNGTIDTLLKLTDTTLEEALLFPQKCANKMRQTPFFKVILPKMQDYFETENYIFVHGWIPCSVVGSHGADQKEYEYSENWRQADQIEWEGARWINGMAAANNGVTENGKTIVCGHYRCSYGHKVLEGKEEVDHSPYVAEGIIAIDATTVRSHKINCIVIED